MWRRMPSMAPLPSAKLQPSRSSTWLLTGVCGRQCLKEPPRSPCWAHALLEHSRGEIDISTAIHALRRRAGVTQGELAVRAGISASYLAGVEGGWRDSHSSTLKRLLPALEDKLNKLAHRPCGQAAKVVAQLNRQAIKNSEEHARAPAPSEHTNVNGSNPPTWLMGTAVLRGLNPTLAFANGVA